MMRPAWVLATLVDFVVSNSLPNPTSVLTLVDTIQSEAMLLTSNFQLQKQLELSRSIAAARRRIGAQHAALGSKQSLLISLTQSQMKGSFLCSGAGESDTYVHLQMQVAKVLGRYAAARDNLGAANANFVSAAHLYHLRNQNFMEERLSIMAKLNSIVQPLNLITSTWSTNLYGPLYWSSVGPDWQTCVRVFWVMMALYTSWLLLWVPGLVKQYVRLGRHVEITFDNEAFAVQAKV
jgi:Mg2+ and Co2+ transporter CorA